MSDSPTRVLISGDHSTYHGGSAAVIEAIRHLLLGENVTLTSPGEPFDLLLVNGEGSMHHDSSECVAKMARIEAAQMLGKKTGLINAVWQENSGRFDTVLRRLDILTLRGPASAKDLRDRHGIAAFHHPDLSLFAPLTACAPKVDYGGSAVVTDYFDHVFGGFVRSTSGPLARLPYFDLAAHGWSDAIATLATASTVVTGRHHVMYAALRARVPFVLLEANTHKLQDLLDAAGVTLPICRTQAEVLAALQHIGLNRRIYDQLFDWAASQSPPDLLRMTEAQPLVRNEGASRLVYRARLEMMMGRPRQAFAVMSEALAARARFPEAQHHRIALAAGEGWLSAQLLAEKLVSDGGSLRELATASGFGRDAAGWTTQVDDLTGPDWWRAAVTLLHGARASTQPVTEEQIRAVLDLTQGVAEREAARLMMEERAAKLWRMDISDILNRLLDKEHLPKAYTDHAAILVAARFALYDETQLGEAQRQLRHPDLLCPARLAILVEYLRRFSEDLPGLLHDAQAALHRAEGARAELQLRVAALALSIGEKGAASAALALGSVPKSALHRCLKVAAFTGGLPSPRLEALAAAAPDDLGFAQRVADRALTVAVVGNGVLAEDLPPGEIDSHDIVIRINDFLLGDAWGERVDYHVTVMQGQVGFGQQHLSRVRFGTLLRNADLVYRSRDWGPTLQMLELGHPVGILPSAHERALSREIGTEPSTGLAILTAILGLRGTMRGLSVFGMPKLLGVDDDRRAQGDICHQRHFWQREASYLRKMMG